MLYVKPDFYNDFQCIADKCRHSCCKGWEIDIDQDTAELYSQLPGELGDELRREICQEPDPHFNLSSDERCPFLNEQGLCRLILGYGEDVLCDICREHPRFYNDFSERMEMGLGLCCEEAVRLLLGGTEPLKLMCFSDGEGESSTPEVLKIRERVLAIIAETSLSIERRIEKCCDELGIDAFSFDGIYWQKIFLSLERMDEDWTEALKSMERDKQCLTGDMAHTRLLQYMLYRNMTAGEYSWPQMLKFCFVSFCLICDIEHNGRELADVVRLWSAEIEYSDENIGIIVEKL